MASKKQLISLIEATKEYLISNEKRLPDNQYTDELCDWINQVLREEGKTKCCK